MVVNCKEVANLLGEKRKIAEIPQLRYVASGSKIELGDLRNMKQNDSP
jgi:hypothetical protein